MSTPADASVVQSPVLSRALAAACVAVALLLPLGVALALWLMPVEALLQRLGLPGMGVSGDALQPWQRHAGWLLGMVPASCAACGLWHARRCFLHFARGDYFAEAAIGSLRGFSVGMLAAAVAGIVVPSLASVVLSWELGPGRRQLAVAVSSNDLLLLLFAAVVWQIAVAMRRAAALAQENAAFV